VLIALFLYSYKNYYPALQVMPQSRGLRTKMVSFDMRLNFFKPDKIGHYLCCEKYRIKHH